MQYMPYLTCLVKGIKGCLLLLFTFLIRSLNQTLSAHWLKEATKNPFQVREPVQYNINGHKTGHFMAKTRLVTKRTPLPLLQTAPQCRSKTQSDKKTSKFVRFLLACCLKATSSHLLKHIQKR